MNTSLKSIKRFSLAVTVLVVILATSIGIGAASAQSVCSPATAISVPFTKDGAGTFCYQATSLCEYVNSWNMTTVSINGTNYTNVWVAASSVSPLNGVYTITYNGPYAWSHMEIAGTCSGGGPTNTPVPPTNTQPPANTATRTNTPAVTNTPAPATNTPVNTPTRTNTPVPTSTQSSGGNVPWLSTSGRYINDPSGNHVILRGVSIVDVGVADSRSRTAIDLINMATNSSDGWYAKVMRFPVYPDAIDFTPGWNAGPDTYFNNHLNPAIQTCIAKQIYCIIDWHYITDYNTSAVDTATRNFWTYIAPKYANTPNVIFELYNEPVNPDNWSTWKSVAQPWVNLIRSYAPNNLILVGGPRWSQNVAEAATNPFSGGNIAYVCHIYPQHGGQSTWDSWFGNSSSTVPYFITEWGWQNGGGAPTSGTLSGYGIPFSNYLASKGVSWTAWVFDLYWQPVMWDENWNLLGGEDYMGQYTKQLLAQYNGGPTSTPPPATNTPVGPTPTRTPTPGTNPTATPTQGSGGSCSPVSATISAPFTKDGSGTFCWQSNNLGSYINSWNLNSLTINGVNATNVYVGSGSYPAQIGGYWYVSYNSSVAWGHFEAK